MSSTPEIEWDENEQGLMLGLAEYRAGLCGRCGGHLDDTTDPARDGDNPFAPEGYHVPDPRTCYLCEALTRAEKAMADRKDLGVHQTSFHYAVHLVRKKSARKPKARKRRE